MTGDRIWVFKHRAWLPWHLYSPDFITLSPFSLICTTACLVGDSDVGYFPFTDASETVSMVCLVGVPVCLFTGQPGTIDP